MGVPGSMQPAAPESNSVWWKKNKQLIIVIVVIIGMIVVEHFFNKWVTQLQTKRTEREIRQSQQGPKAKLNELQKKILERQKNQEEVLDDI